MEKLSEWLWDLYSNTGIQEKQLTVNDIRMMFLGPLRTYEAKHMLDSVEKEFLLKLERWAGSLVGSTLPLTGCHGDFLGWEYFSR